MNMTHRPVLERRLKAHVEGDVLFDSFSRGRYATDASSYQIMPLGVVVPRNAEAAAAAMTIAREEGVAVTARGGGTSQAGQTVNDGLIIDCSRYVANLLSVDQQAQSCIVEPGIVLDELNRQLKPHGLWFPVDVSTASRATIGGMVGNNSCGGRSLRYGTTRDNVVGLDAILADGNTMHFGDVRADLSDVNDTSRRALFSDLLALGAREAEEVRRNFPAVQRRVGGYNLDALIPNGGTHNMSHVLVGSEGTLAYTSRAELKLWPVLGRRGLGVCHFGSFHAAMESAQHLVTLKPIAVELVDRTMLELASEIAVFRPTLNAFLKGSPDALLLVEFAESDDENKVRLKQLTEMMGDLGLSWGGEGARWGGVVEVFDPKLQAGITEVRTSGLNIMMSMKEARKPVSFIEDCAVPLQHLGEYTSRLTALFARHGTRGTWYAHASVGCLHVRPVLNLKLDEDIKTMRLIAEEAFDLVKQFKGSHSGEHGDGIVRSEFHEKMFGERLVKAFGEVKHRFDPKGLLNPGKIVDAPKFDDRTVLRFNDHYRASDLNPVLDWSSFSGAAAGLQGAVEMCNNNGACRKLQGGAMCPSYRATRDEKHVTRGRANALRLALSGQLGENAFAGEAMADAMSLCVSCKACRRECPTGVDMARLKIEVQAARRKTKGLSWRDRAIAFLPHYAPWAAKFPVLFNLRDLLPGAAALSEKLLGLSAERSLPKWRSDIFAPKESVMGPENGPEVVLFVDTFNRYQDSENAVAALQVLVAAGYRVHLPKVARAGQRPLCCGRTFIATGLVDEARAEMERSLAVLAPFAERGLAIVGIEPSCLYGFRDEVPSLVPTPAAKAVAEQSMLFEEFLAREASAGRLHLPLKGKKQKVLVHGHCHQKSFGAMGAVEKALRLIPELEVEIIESSCCGMAGAFGYQAETYEVSKAMGELSLLPAVRGADKDTLIVADGTSCRHQIKDGSAREAVHIARLLADRLAVL